MEPKPKTNKDPTPGGADLSKLDEEPLLVTAVAVIHEIEVGISALDRRGLPIPRAFRNARTLARAMRQGILNNGNGRHPKAAPAPSPQASNESTKCAACGKFFMPDGAESCPVCRVAEGGTNGEESSQE